MKIFSYIFIFGMVTRSKTHKLSTEKEYEILNKNLEDYNVNHPHSGRADVYVQIRLNSFTHLDAVKMEYGVDLTLRQVWNDSRLAYNDGDDFIIVQDPKMLSRIWKPDTFFYNVKDAKIHEVTMPNVLFRIEKNGEILYILRIKMVVECDMDLRDYPFDRQRCGLELLSFSTTSDKMRFHWGIREPFKMPGRRSIPQFDLYSNFTKEKEFTYTIGNFSGLEVKFYLRRLYGYYLIHAFIPTFLIVTISWVSFWIDPNAVPGRVTLGVTTILTLTTLSTGVGYRLPPVSYIKAIDIWLAVCMSMVFAALLEFTVVNYLANKKMPPVSPEKVPQFDEVKNGSNNKATTYISQARTVDRICRVAFPTSFLSFNLIYWPYYLMQIYSAEV